MSSDNHFIEIIPLGNRPVEAGCVTEKMLEIISQNIISKQKTLIFYNRRGSASAWICQDCGFFEKCPNCDIAFSYHTFPSRRLLCHQCNFSEKISFECPVCQGHRFVTAGVGIEQIAENISRRISARVEIFDSDHIKKTTDIFEKLDKCDVLLSTSLGALLTDNRIGSVIFALFEVNISVPDYALEEEIYSQISYVKKQQIPLYIQTFAPEYPLLKEIVFGNYKSFLALLKNERKTFSYPPFVDFVTIRIHHKQKEIVKNTLLGLVERIEKMEISDTFFAYDKDIWEKHHGEYMQKIVLKGKNVIDILESLSSAIVRNRNIFVDWH